MVGSKADSAAACQFLPDRCWAGSPIPCIELLIDLFLFLKQEGYCFLCFCLPLLPPLWQLLQKTPAATATTSSPVYFSLEAADVPITLH